MPGCGERREAELRRLSVHEPDRLDKVALATGAKDRLRGRMTGLHLVAWYDRFCRSTVANYLAMSRTGTFQRLIVGPWPHGVPVLTVSGDRHLGPRASVDARELVVRWYDRWLRGIENGIDREPPVRLYFLGQDAWRDADAWPLPYTRFTRLHLHGGGAANTRRGDGALGEEPPGDEPVDVYVYDPAHPTPSVPGRMARPWGSVDQGPIEERRDVLCYSTPPLASDVDVIGPFEARIWAATSARDTIGSSSWSTPSPTAGSTGWPRGCSGPAVECRSRRPARSSPTRCWNTSSTSGRSGTGSAPVTGSGSRSRVPASRSSTAI